MKKLILLASLFCLGACSPDQLASPADNERESTNVLSNYPAVISLRKQLSCLPKEAAFVAAHRGVSKKENLAENSGTALKALIEHGVMIAEVDVAGLKDGTNILFHDGVWDEKSSGKGAVAASSWSRVKDYLLRDTDGDFSADRPIKLEDALSISKDLLYLEVDFKSSAKYGSVIKAIRKADMSDQVLLIAYTDGQARKLAKMAPEMMISVSAKSKNDIENLSRAGVKKSNMAVWMGKGPYPREFINYLDDQDIPVLAWPNEGQRRRIAGPATVMVTDYALQKNPIEGLSGSARSEYEACLAN